MRLSAVSRAELEAGSQALFERQMAHLRAVRGGDGAAPDPAPVNMDAARSMDRPREYTHRGVRYTVPPISYEAGLDLASVVTRLMAGGGHEEMLRTYRDAVRLAGSLMRPTGWRRLVRPILRNPFALATEAEMGRVLDFLWTCRTGLPFRMWIEAQGLPAGRPTTSSDSTSSRTRGTGDPGRGRTTSMGSSTRR